MSIKHSSEYKAKIALEALHLTDSELDAFADTKGLNKADIIQWIDTLNANASNLFSDQPASAGHHAPAAGEDFTISSDDVHFIADLAHGAHEDRLNYKTLFFWTTLGTATVAALIFALIPFAQYSIYNAGQNASVNSVYSQITDLKAQQAETLNSFGVIDLENGIYHIPIDQAINLIVKD